MKERSIRPGGSKAAKRPIKPAKKQPAPAKGRWSKPIWLSPEYIGWCKRNCLQPERIASALAHTFALRMPEPCALIISSQRPVEDDEYLDHDGEEEAP